VARRALTLILLVVLLALVAVPAAGARVYLGVYGNRGSFPPASHPVGHVIAAWNQGPVSRILDSLGTIPMLGLSTGALTSQAIAAGAGDAWLTEINHAIAERPSLVYVRPMGEMDGYWNPYCAYNQNGTARSPAFSTRNFRRAFARISILLRGGAPAGVNAALRRAGLPPYAGEPLEANSKQRMRVIWNPLGWPDPKVPGNATAQYYPGDAFVDVVGGDVYKTPSNVGHLTALEQLYTTYRTKPFSIPEWGLNGVDDPDFVRRVADFLRTHKRTEVAVYFNGRGGSSFDLASKPRSRAAYAKLIVPLARAA
jgi:hypothetical protein